MNSEFIHIVEAGIKEYANECRRRIPTFAKKTYTYPGAWHLNKHGFGWDLLRSPANLIWAPIYVFLGVTGYLLRLYAKNPISKLLQKIPAGFQTKVQKLNEQKIRSEIFSSPDRKTHTLYETIENRLVKSLEKDRKISLSEQEKHEFHQRIDEILSKALKEVEITRTASADISNTLISTALGALAFKKFTPGGIGIGLLLSAFLAKHQASQNFWLGTFVGEHYYLLFPPEPSIGLVAFSILFIMLIFSFLASFSGLLIDPIQVYLGLHRRRLLQLVNTFEDDLLKQTAGSFNPKDKYLARIMEIFDAVRSSL